MNKIIFGFFFLFFGSIQIHAQNLCELALDITGESGTCFELDFNSATYDVLNGDCSTGTDHPNQWFKFTAEGPELEINTTHENGLNIAIALIRFTTGDCDPVKFTQDTCAINNLTLISSLIIGQEYYIEMHVAEPGQGIGEMCFTQPDITPPPYNDDACTASHITPDGFCFNGSTLNAESDIEDINCNFSTMSSVWYSFDLSDGDYFAAKISIENLNLPGDVQVIIGEYNAGCENGFQFIQKYCGPPGEDILDNNQLVPGNKYYVNVATLPTEQGSFKICIQEQEAVPHADPCEAVTITPNASCEFVDTYYSQLEYDIVPCDYSNHILWYTFNSGESMEDVQVYMDLISGSEDIFIGLGLFNGNWCMNSFEFLETYCGPIQNAVINADSILDFKPYYIVIGSTKGFTGQYNLCLDVDYESPFDNANPCTAYELNQIQNCIGGSNVYGAISEDTICNGQTAKENWYKIDLNESGHDVSLDFQHNSNQVYKIQLGFFENGCLDSFIVKSNYCSPLSGQSLQMTLHDSLDMAYIRVLTNDTIDINFNLCLNKQNIGFNCRNNDFCVDANDMGALELGDDLCFEACTFSATQEDIDTGYLAQFPTTWYEIGIGEDINQLRVDLNSSSTPGVLVSIFESCNLEDKIESIYSFNVDDVRMFFDLESEKIYKIAITQTQPSGGKVDVCLRGLNSNTCNKQDRIEVVETSMNSPLEGPYLPGETLQICYQLEDYFPNSESDCQWIQGIIPSFSEGWDLSQLDSIGKPNIRREIMPLGNQVVWGWKTNVHASMDNENRRLGDFNGDGNIDLCHVLAGDCSGDALMTGDTLPAGWYAWNLAQSSMNPDSTYGDGSSCDANNGVWEICFDMTISDTIQNNSLSIDMHTFADGEIGIQSKKNISCSQDMPLTKTFHIACVAPQSTMTMDTIDVCSDLSFKLIGDPNNHYYWVGLQNEFITGITSGGGFNATQKLKNNSNTIQEAVYQVESYLDNCPLGSTQVLVRVFPEISIPEPELTTICLGDSIAMNEIVNLDSLIIEPFEIDWGTGSLFNEPDAIWKESEDETIGFFIITNSGCTDSGDIEIHVENVDVGAHVEPLTICKNEVTTMNEIIDLDLHIQEPFTVDWRDSTIENTSMAEVSFEQSGSINFIVTGTTGCTFEDEILVTVPEVDISIMGIDLYCDQDTILLTSDYEYDFGHTTTWVLPNGITYNFDEIDLPASEFGAGTHIFNFELETDQNCKFSASDTILINEYPTLAINQDTTYLGICSYDSLTLSATVNPPSFDLAWTSDVMDIQGQEFVTNQEGWYYIQAGVPGCVNRDSFHVEIYPDVVNEFSHPPLVCGTDSATIIAQDPDYFFAWSTDEFSSEITVAAGDYSVTVSNIEGCQEIYDFSIEHKEIPSTTFIYQDTLCAGDTTTITSSNIDLDYAWSSGQAGSEIVVQDGIYKVTFTDENMCFDTATIDIVGLPYPDIDIILNVFSDTLNLQGDVVNADTCFWLIDDDLFPYVSPFQMVLPTNKEYEISLICNNGPCYTNDTTTVFIDPVSIYKDDILDINIYPNPSEGKLIVDNLSEYELNDISLFSLDGKKIASFYPHDQRHSVHLDLNLEPGLYTIHVNTAQGVTIRKIVIE